MEQIYKKMIHRAIADLTFLQTKDLLQFKVITKDGTSAGDLNVGKVPKVRTKAPSIYPQGEVRNYIMPYIKQLKEQELASIPFGKYEPETLRGNLCAWATTVWGKGTYTTAINKKAHTVEILRMTKEM